MLNLAGRRDIPIITGAAGPLFGELIYYPEFHGKEGMGTIKPPDTIENVQVFDFYKVLGLGNQYKGNLVIVSVGRLTELALMFILFGKDALKDVTAFYIHKKPHIS